MTAWKGACFKAKNIFSSPEILERITAVFLNLICLDHNKGPSCILGYYTADWQESQYIMVEGRERRTDSRKMKACMY